MSTPRLDQWLGAAVETEASDLHLVQGIPPAFRVNGEIILADSDAVPTDELRGIADSLLNDAQRRKFEQDWELCVSLVHPVAGRMRVTF